MACLQSALELPTEVSPFMVMLTKVNAPQYLNQLTDDLFLRSGPFICFTVWFWQSLWSHQNTRIFCQVENSVGAFSHYDILYRKHVSVKGLLDLLVLQIVMKSSWWYIESHLLFIPMTPSESLIYIYKLLFLHNH